MKTRRIYFWGGTLLLSSGAILCIGMAKHIGSSQFQRLRELTTFIEQSLPGWEGMEIAGHPLPLFLKDLWLNNSILLDLAALASALFGLLVIFLAANLVIEKRKKRDT